MHFNVADLITILGTLSLGLVGCFGMDGGGCNYDQNSFLTQIESKSNVNYILSTMDNKTNPPPSSSMNSFEVPISELNPNLLDSNYLITTVQYTTSGTCTPSHVISVERFTIGKLRLQADDAFHSKAASKVQEAQECISNNPSRCSGIESFQYYKDDVDKIRSIDANTLKDCSLDAIRENMARLEELSSNQYIVGCAVTKSKDKELPLYFEQNNDTLLFKGVLF
ncbi:hypothetical protein [Psychrobacter sp. BI730]|uniref:hypothetical protein n=1 Tax=Psychrobacter sp. BI730 TaxID=2705463 RepID=UPI0015CE1760|nr:hypothetical protein [Psychrobacter sp. BI730]NYR10866.1 hypothetical protein [Psychrobacter sp. BI730]